MWRRTDSELEAVSCVCVDVFECFLHGQSEQDQLTEVMPVILTLLNTTKGGRKEWRIMGREKRRGGKREAKKGEKGHNYFTSSWNVNS